MLGYIVRRLFSAFLVITLTTMFVFALFFLGPSNPAEPLCNINGKCTPEKLAILTEQMGLNDSVVHQYGIWVKGLFVDREIDFGATYECSAPCLGISFRSKEEVTQGLLERFPATLSLALGGAALYLVFGVTLGVLAARWRGSFGDRGLVAFSIGVSAIPYYVLALLAWVFLSLKWKVFEDTSYTPFTENPAEWFWGLLLPWLVLGLAGSTAYARFTRGQMVETLGEDYVRTARAKGVKSQKVYFKHALRAAIVPIVTIFGLDFAFLLTGTIFTEVIFQIDGIGKWAIEAIFSPIDFPVVAGTVLFGAVIVVVANLVVDIIYSVIDPRVRIS